jgi:hypothetical protein
MIAKNPMKNPESKEKMRTSIIRLQKDGKLLPYGGRKQGNGMGMTPSESGFHNLFPLAIYNYAIRTYQTEASGYPGAYKVDFAWPGTKVSVDIDGLLSKLGWTCYRLTNLQILSNQIPSSILKSLQALQT